MTFVVLGFFFLHFKNWLISFFMVKTCLFKYWSGSVFLCVFFPADGFENVKEVKL